MTGNKGRRDWLTIKEGKEGRKEGCGGGAE